MKIGVAVVSLLLLASSPPVDAERRRPVRPPEPIVDQQYLNAARAAARWLDSLQRTSSNGAISWPAVEGSGGASTGIDLGASGIGTFYLRLFHATGERDYLDKAIGAGIFVANSYAAGGGGVDWLGGRAGGGDFFLLLFDATGDVRWLDDAKRAATVLINAGISEADTIHWRNGQLFTSVAHGAAGIGLFFLHLHEATGEAQYLDVAMRAFRWIMRHTLPAGDGITLKRLTTDSGGYHGWCGGSVGAALFFEELARVSGDPAVFAAWQGILQGLLDTALRRGTPAEPQLLWRYGPTSAGNAPIVYCHGGSGAGAIFGKAFVALGDLRYHEAARAAGRWLEAVAIRHDGGGRSWNHIEGSASHELGLFTGAASVGHASLEIYRALRDPADLERARAAAAWLLSVGTSPDAGQMKWITRTDTSHTARFETGLYMGTAGVGLFLLELHETLEGDVLPRRFSIFNP